MVVVVAAVKRVLLIVVLIVAALIAVLMVRTLTIESRQISATPVAPPVLDRAAVLERFSFAIQLRMVSSEWVTGYPFAEWLRQSYPHVHRSMSQDVLNDAALLYTWPGSDPALEPLLLMGHYDTVPVEPDAKWTHDPFSGAIANGYVWGRGALDDKITVVALMEAAELLLKQGHRPRRTILFAFGHDEETGGVQGAGEIARLLDERRVKLYAVVDEGGVITVDSVEGAPRPVAVIGIAEKGSVSIELRAQGRGGHSSMPPGRTPVGRIASAVERVQNTPFEADVRGAAQETFRWLAPEMPFAQQLALSNLWLFEPLLKRQARRSASFNATLRTTIAPTMIGGGTKDNVLPSEARAVVNFRILPGETVQSVVEHARRAIDDERVQIRTVGGAWDPSPVSDPDAPPFRALQKTIMQNFPDTIVAPYLVVGATDARWFRHLTPNVYRFVPLALTQRDLQRVHGVDERVSVEAYLKAIGFYRTLMINMAD